MSDAAVRKAIVTGASTGIGATPPTVADEAMWAAYEASRKALQSHLAAGQPAPRYRLRSG